MVTTISLVNIITTFSSNFFSLVVRTFKMYSLVDFQKYNPGFITHMATILFILSPGLLCLITGSLYFLTPFIILPSSPNLCQPPACSLHL